MKINYFIICLFLFLLALFNRYNAIEPSTEETETTEEPPTEELTTAYEEAPTEELTTAYEEAPTEELTQPTEPPEIEAIRAKYGTAGRIIIEAANIDVPLYYDFGATKYNEDNAAGIYWNNNQAIIIVDHNNQNNFDNLRNVPIGSQLIYEGEGYPRKFTLVKSYHSTADRDTYYNENNEAIALIPGFYVVTCEGEEPGIRITEWIEQ